MIRSLNWTALKSVPLRHFTFFLEQSQKLKPLKSSRLSQVDIKAREELFEVARRADEESSDLTPYLEEQDKLKGVIQSAQSSLLQIEEDIKKMKVELPSTPSLQLEIDSAHEKKTKL